MWLLWCMGDGMTLWTELRHTVQSVDVLTVGCRERQTTALTAAQEWTVVGMPNPMLLDFRNALKWAGLDLYEERCKLSRSKKE